MRGGGGDLLSALAERGEDGHVAADDVLEVDLGARVVFDADDDGGAGDVFHAAVLHPEFVGRAGVDGDGGGHVAE